MENVIYCEMLFMGNPIEIKMPKDKAIERYNGKLEALKGYLFQDACFIGIKNLNNKWIVNNN